jgi:hypothetical protein
VHNGEASLQQSDTSSDARERQLELIRSMSPQARLELAMSMSESTRELSLASLQRLHPQETDQQLRLRLAGLLYGEAARDRIAAALSRGRP